MNWSLDFGKESTNVLPFNLRKSISILLGAGFSAPKGYPIGNDMNERLLHFDDSKLDFSPDGSLITSIDGTKPKFQIDGLHNVHQKYFIFCKRLIKEYADTHNGEFDYELFYDFLTSEETNQNKYRRLSADLIGQNGSHENFVFNCRHIYNQMVAHLLKDKDGKTWYDDEPFRINSVDGYNGFLQTISNLSRDFIINVHTLNHDLFFESFNNTGFINGAISDGFDEFGSDYYGKLSYSNRIYHCRLERYTGRYNSAIRLYKLHGSLDYVPYYRTDSYGSMRPEKYVKIKYGIGTGNIIKGRKSKIGYDISPFEYHSDFLTGTTSKIKRYNEPLLFKKLFKKFKTNLRNAEILIIIGYGCKDNGINEMIKDHFNYSQKKVFIIDKYVGETVEAFGRSINAKLCKVDINDITMDIFD